MQPARLKASRAFYDLSCYELEQGNLETALRGFRKATDAWYDNIAAWVKIRDIDKMLIAQCGSGFFSIFKKDPYLRELYKAERTIEKLRKKEIF